MTASLATAPSFDHLLAAYAPRVHRAALGMMGEEQEAREVAQDALLKAYRARERYDPARPFYPWLYRIVKNSCLDALARRRHRARPGLDEQRVHDCAPTVLDRIGQQESIARVQRGIARLSEAHREILSMRHFQDLTYVEMSMLLEVPEGTVMSRLYRARRALVRVLEEDSP